jgi:hypothetical protein
MAINQETQDAFALLNIIKIAEKDIAERNTRKAVDVFNDIKKTVRVLTIVDSRRNLQDVLGEKLQARVTS